MAEGSAPAAKVCAACSKDVSKLPRTKDAQGRYLCADCLAKRKAKSGDAKPGAKGGPAATKSPGDMDVMSKLLAETPGVELCPNCGGGITVGSKICVRCGFNKETGKAMKVRVELAGKDKERAAKSMPKLSFGPGTYLMMLAGLVSAGFVASIFNPGWGLLLYAAAGLMLFAAQIWAIIAAFQDEDTVYGILGLLGLFCVPFVGLATLYYGLFKTSRDYLKMTTWAAVIGLILGLVGILGAVPLDEAGLMASESDSASIRERDRDTPDPDAPPPAGENLFGG